MTGPDEAVRMTVAEIAVMREIVKWCKVSNVGETYAARWEAQDEVAWRPHKRRGRAVDFEVAWRGLRVAFGGSFSHDWHDLPVRTFTEGVDVLVAVGFLPARFSSAYAQGWNVGREDIEHPVAAGAEFATIVPARRSW
jgi:hypothetical protein